MIALLAACLLSIGQDAGQLIEAGKRKIDEKEFAGAIKDLTRAIELEPANAEAYFWRGTALTKSGDNEAARKDLTRALELDPRHTDARARRAWVHKMLGKCDEAIRDATRILESKPYPRLRDDMLYVRAASYMLKDEYKPAIRDFESMIAADPRSSLAYWGIGSCFWRIGEQHKAIAHLTKALEFFPGEESIMSTRAVAYYEAEAWEKAIDDLTAVLEKEPDYYSLHLRLWAARCRLSSSARLRSVMSVTIPRMALSAS